MYTKINIYKVTFEHVLTGLVSSVLVESTNSNDAGISVITNLGKDYELISSITTSSNDLM